MPGPKAASNAKGRKPSPNSPNKRTQHRLDRRINAYNEAGGESAKDGSGRAMKMHKPGSQNRKK